MSAGDTIPCYICKKPFVKYNGRSKFCSDRCRRTTATSVYRDPIDCPYCHLSFVPSSDQVKYCSPFCRERHKAEKLKVEMPLKKCGMCDNTFKPVNGSHSYCSLRCKQEARRRLVNLGRATPESKAKVKAYNESYQRHPDSRSLKNHNLKTTYGITIEDYEGKLETQGGLCGMCHKEPPGKRPLCVDHCHATDVVRDLLCIKCNNIIGNADDQIALLEDAIQYLIRYLAPQR